jgi:hypothetical protein
MRALSSSGILTLSERGASLHPVDRALLMLAVAAPGERWEDLAALGIGERDARLIELREKTFGPVLESDAHCPFCSERLEFSLSTRELRRRPSSAESMLETLEIDGVAVRFRLPDSHDLAAAARCSDPREARRLIAGRCSSRADDSSPIELDDEAITALAGRMAEADPCIDITLELACPACAGRWEMVLDITSFLWAEIRDEARRLLRDVHTLARAYGWSEREILDLSPARRRSYLEMVG